MRVVAGFEALPSQGFGGLAAEFELGVFFVGGLFYYYEEAAEEGGDGVGHGWGFLVWIGLDFIGSD